MARKNKAKKSQPVRDRTPLASRRVHNTRPANNGPALALNVRRVADPHLPVMVKRKSPRTNYTDVKSSVADRTPLAVSAPGAVKAKKITTEKHRQQSKLKLALTPEPDVRKSSEKARDPNRCKKRPDSKRAARSSGGGGGKKYVPWC